MKALQNNAFCRPALCLLLVLFLAMPSFAQSHLMGGGMGMGGFIGPVVKFSTIDGTPAFFVGGRAGMTIALDSTSNLAIGGGMYGLMSSIATPAIGTGGDAEYLRLSYGGIELEYQFRPGNLVHLSATTLLGVGWSGSYDDDYSYGRHNNGHSWGYGRGFLVAEPGAGVTLNVTPFLRLGLDASYRFAGSSASPELRGMRLSGPAAALRLQIGRHM